MRQVARQRTTKAPTPAVDGQSARVATGAKRSVKPRLGRQRSTETMLAAAAQLFIERGPSNVTVRDIAARAGVSHTLVHAYLGTKEDVLIAVVTRGDQAIKESAEGLPGLRDAARSMLGELRHSQPQHLRTVASIALSDVPYGRLGAAFPSIAALRERADLEFGRTDVGRSRRLEIAPNFLIAALVALAVGWGSVEDYLIPAAGLEDLDREAIDAGLERVLMCLIDAALPPHDADAF